MNAQAASALVASLDHDIGRQEAPKKVEPKPEGSPKVGEKKTEGPSKGALKLKGAMKKIKLGLKIKRAFTPAANEAPLTTEAAAVLASKALAAAPWARMATRQ